HDLRRSLFRYAVQFRRHSARRNLGRSIMGTFLGLGPEREWRGVDRPLVRNHLARALGRVHPTTRPDDHGALRQHRYQFLVVRREHARRGSAFLRLHAKSVSVAGWIHDHPIGINGRRWDGAGGVAEAPDGGGAGAKLPCGECASSWPKPASLARSLPWLIAGAENCSHHSTAPPLHECCTPRRRNRRMARLARQKKETEQLARPGRAYAEAHATARLTRAPARNRSNRSLVKNRRRLHRRALSASRVARRNPLRP